MSLFCDLTFFSFSRKCPVKNYVMWRIKKLFYIISGVPWKRTEIPLKVRQILFVGNCTLHFCWIVCLPVIYRYTKRTIFTFLLVGTSCFPLTKIGKVGERTFKQIHVSIRQTPNISSHLQVIEDTEHHSKTHVDDPDDNWHLHLVGVEKGQPVHRHVPYLTGH